jgi:predicted adenylyl cyclase CyaB
MARNIEIKARVPDPAALRRRAAALTDTPAEMIPQEDTFFHVPQGRLKLRVITPDHGQLIYYQRPDTAGPKQSDYHIAVTAEPQTLKNVLARSLGVRGVVTKQRWLYLVGPTRIHLDQVEGLGSFMELEVLLQADQSPAEGQAIAADLMAQLGIQEKHLVEGAYIDLLEKMDPSG